MQLELLGRAFDFVSRDDLVEAVAGDRTLPERACIVTFDDGLRCQLEHALPVLERLEVPAVFFIPGLPVAERRALSVHKLHHVREQLSDVELLAELDQTRIPAVDDEAARAHYRYDTPEAARVKYLLNVVLPPPRRDAVVDAIFARVHGDEAGFCEQLYMSRHDVAELERAHKAVGSHSYAHTPLALLRPGERRLELERAVAVLEPLLGTPPRMFSFPHGTPSTVDVASARDVEAAGFAAAFTMERALNRTLEEPRLLGRFDANDVPGGTRPLLDLDDGRLLVGEGASAARTRYFDESVVEV
jgi:peptidoglycan/xylan/chitin deacetylase (PgdA/CDA1 family)